MIKIAILEDELTQAQLIEQALIGGNDNLTVWSDAVECDIFDKGLVLLNQLKQNNPYDCMILDRQLPDMSGDVVLQWLRQYSARYTPVIMLTSLRGEDKTLESLVAGADEYMTKPLAPKELLFRVQRLIKRQQEKDGLRPNESTEACLVVQDYAFNEFELSVTFDDQYVRLTEREFRLALFLFKNLGLNVSREALIEAAWGPGESESRKLDVHLYKIREKLDLVIERGWMLRSIYGYGYRLNSNANVINIGNRKIEI